MSSILLAYLGFMPIKSKFEKPEMLASDEDDAADEKSALYGIVSDTAFGSRNVIEKSLFDWGVRAGEINENDNENGKGQLWHNCFGKRHSRAAAYWTGGKSCGEPQSDQRFCA